MPVAPVAEHIAVRRLLDNGDKVWLMSYNDINNGFGGHNWNSLFLVMKLNKDHSIYVEGEKVNNIEFKFGICIAIIGAILIALMLCS